MERIVTIGREFGSGGRELGRRIAEEMGIAYYDREIVAEIAKRTSLSEEYVRQVVDHRPIVAFPIHVGRSFYPLFAPVWDQGQAVYQEQHKIIEEMASKSGCIIVGRCADYVLRERRPFRIFVYSDMESKMARCRAQGDDARDMSDKELKQHIQDVNKGRARYYEFYTGQTWGDRANYDICVNTTRADITRTASAIVRMIG
ncbi:MAG: cytidylate kinase-like family protein [Synergistaceae bacterium]|nr:cytidylate kinase-like family protein [Synergistaceae bacterium]